MLQQQLICVVLLEIKTENSISNEINSRQLMDVFALKKSHCFLRLLSFYKEGDSNYCLNVSSFQQGLGVIVNSGLTLSKELGSQEENA